MPYQIKWKDNGLIVRYFGDIVSGTQNNIRESIISDPRFDVARFMIFDLSDIETIELDDETAEFNILSATITMRYNRGCKVAIVASGSEISHFIQRHIKHLPEDANWQFKIFGELKKAEQWLFGGEN